MVVLTDRSARGFLSGVARILGQRPKRLEFQDIRPGMSHNHRYGLACPNNYPLLSRAASRSPKPSALGVPRVQSCISTARLLPSSTHHTSQRFESIDLWHIPQLIYSLALRAEPLYTRSIIQVCHTCNYYSVYHLFWNNCQEWLVSSAKGPKD
jgi:hypothetical protein